jgi:serine/threonine protein kinase/Flp pilus assembly protein TadD
MKCPKCNFENPDTQRFCGDCGTQFPPAEEISAPLTETLETPKEELTTGSTFAGRYQIIEELGKGGMGKVYKAQDTDLKEKVAIKLLRPEIAGDKKTIERFRNELKFARKIRHKNVCQMYDLNKEKGLHYITMEYVDGKDLKSMIRMMGQLSSGKTIFIAKQVCEGLIEAHRLGVVHRDLKPQNIMVDEDGNARIMDFGIARSLKTKGITAAGVMIGTPEYMSPEQVEGKEVDQRSDIYSLGVILYEMVTGRVPFEGDTPFTIGVKHKSEMPKDPKEFNTQLPEDLNLVILRCLEKDKEKRCQSAGEVRAELTRIEKGIPTTEIEIPKRKPITSREITVTFGLKKLLIPALVVAALIIAAVVIWQLVSQKQIASLEPAKPSIAVLPFVDLSPQKDQGYFCDGMTDEIIAKLSRFKGWKVIPRTSMMRYKNTDKDIKEIGEELDVATILEGSIRKERDDIRVNAKLIRIKDIIPLWSDTYEKKLESVFAIQSDVAEKIANALQVELSPEEKERLAKKPTENLTAYDYYLRGREYYARYRKQDNERAIELFNKALEFDSDFALAYSGLGDSYAQRTGRFGFPGTWLDESIKVSQKAIALNPDLSEAYKALGLAYLFKGWYRKSIEANLKAIELNPNNNQAIANIGWGYFNRGEFDKAMPWFKRHSLLAPKFPFSFIHMGWIYLGLDDYVQAEQWLNNASELQPHNFDVNDGLILCYLAQGQYQKAVKRSQEWLLMEPNNSDVLSIAGLVELFSGNYEQAKQYYQKSIAIQSASANLTGLGYIYWKKGQLDEARKLLDQSLILCQKQLEQGNEFWSIPYYISAIHAIQGSNEEAYKWLKKAIDAGWRYFRLGSRNPMLENLREDEQFKQMIAEMKEMVYEMRKRIEKNY